MRLVFAGTPDTAVPSLRRLAASDHEIVGVVTRTDAPLGRKRVLTPSPVAAAADELGIPVAKADRLGDEATAAVREWAPDLGVIVAYGALVREPLLSLPTHGWINLHFSLLPRWRGAAPVQRAVMAGDAETGVAVFQLVPELDAGDVFAQEALLVPPRATAGELLAALAVDGADVLADVVDGIADGSAVAVPQEGQPTYATKLALEDGRIRWDRPRGAVLAQIRGVTPEPGAFTMLGDARLKVLAAHEADADVPRREPGEISTAGGVVVAGTADAPIVLERVQPAGKSAMAAQDWWRGLRAADSVIAS